MVALLSGAFLVCSAGAVLIYRRLDRLRTQLSEEQGGQVAYLLGIYQSTCLLLTLSLMVALDLVTKSSG